MVTRIKDTRQLWLPVRPPSTSPPTHKDESGSSWEKEGGLEEWKWGESNEGEYDHNTFYKCLTLAQRWLDYLAVRV